MHNTVRSSCFLVTVLPLIHFPSSCQSEKRLPLDVSLHMLALHLRYVRDVDRQRSVVGPTKKAQRRRQLVGAASLHQELGKCSRVARELLGQLDGARGSSALEYLGCYDNE